MSLLRRSSAVADTEEAEWQALLANPNLYRALRFDTEQELTDVIHPDARAARWSWDTNVKPHGTGSAHVDVLDGDGQNNGLLGIDITEGQLLFGPSEAQKKYCVQFRQRMPSAFCYAAYPGNNNGFGNGQKHVICSHHSGSNQDNEVVIEDSFQFGAPTWYYQNSGGFQTDWIEILGGAAYRMQTGVDNGGAASTLAEARARYGLLYVGAEKNCGTPVTPQGGFYYAPDEWMRWQIWIDFTLGFAQTRVAMWAQHPGQAPVRFVNRLVSLGTDNGGHTRVWPTTYCTDRTSNGGFDTGCWYSAFATASDLLPMGSYTVSLS